MPHPSLKPNILTDAQIRADAHPEQLLALVGQKALGLSSLPPLWSPPFCVLTNDYLQAWINGSRSALKKFRTEIWPQIVAALQIDNVQPQELILRSSSSREDLTFRGTLSSSRCRADCRSASKEIALLARQNARTLAPSPYDVAIIVQPLLSAPRTGHLSNERRVSRNRNEWLLETDSDGTLTAARIRASSIGTIMKSSPLYASAPAEVSNVLSGLAANFLSPDHRYHFEWVWDGKRIWTVQCDSEARTSFPPPGAEWRHQPTASSTEPTHVLRTAHDDDSNWPKARCIKKFRECNLPHGIVYILDDAPTLNDLAHGCCSQSLTLDLDKLCSEPIVIRSDAAQHTDIPSLLLPRTDCVTNVRDAQQFLILTSRSFIDDAGLRADQFCFLFHRYIAASGAAHAVAWPDRSIVNVDATWGLPEGLNYFPHDSYIFDCRSADSRAQIRCKSHFLDVDTAGQWKARLAGWNLDWRRCLNAVQLHEIATTTKDLANSIGRAVDVMFFVDTLSGTECHRILPWYYTTECIAARSELAPYRYVGARHHVRNRDDLEQLQRKCTASRTRLSVRLCPNEHLVRDHTFLQSVIDLCKGHDLPVEIEGSVLSHAYYLLVRAGLSVRCVDKSASRPLIHRFGKLVRDQIPVNIKMHGERVRFARVPRAQLVAALKEKLLEEAMELVAAQSSESMLDEMADAYEVLRALAAGIGVTVADVIAAADRKRAKRGGFNEGYYLIDTAASGALDTVDSPSALFPNSQGAPGEGAMELVSFLAATRGGGTTTSATALVPLIELADSSRASPRLNIPDGTKQAIFSIDGKMLRVVFSNQASAMPANVHQLTLQF